MIKNWNNFLVESNLPKVSDEVFNKCLDEIKDILISWTEDTDNKVKVLVGIDSDKNKFISIRVYYRLTEQQQNYNEISKYNICRKMIANKAKRICDRLSDFDYKPYFQDFNVDGSVS